MSLHGSCSKVLAISTRVSVGCRCLRGHPIFRSNLNQRIHKRQLSQSVFGKSAGSYNQSVMMSNTSGGVTARKRSLVEDDIILENPLNSDNNSNIDQEMTGRIEESLVVLDKKTEGKVEEVFGGWEWLAQYGPRYLVSGEDVRIIQSPDDFYRCLLEKSKSARSRISLASLYLGNGKLEKELVTAIEKNGAGNSNLSIKVLLDFTRGSRGSDNSRTMLVPLIKNCYDCQVFLYHTPALRGFWKRWLPQRWNEIIGLQHMKIYIFDDSIIISGANLSTDYFTNRQDRYVVIENCKEMADFYEELIDKVSDFSFKLDEENVANLKAGWKVHPSEGDYNDFISAAKNHVVRYYEQCRDDSWTELRSKSNVEDKSVCLDSSKSKKDTWIFPLIQMGSIGISYDKEATCKVFGDAPPGSHIKLATGYFNLTAEYVDKILQNSNTSYEILMAHPKVFASLNALNFRVLYLKANGFFGAKGFAGGIPAAYTLLAKQFLDNASSKKQLYRLTMKEYIRTEWTYHAKGLWFYPPNGTKPSATLIGSPNFGHRSVYRDLESQLYIITSNANLRQQLESEQQHLFDSSKPFVSTELSQPNRVVPLWVRMVIKVFRNFF